MQGSTIHGTWIWMKEITCCGLWSCNWRNWVHAAGFLIARYIVAASAFPMIISAASLNSFSESPLSFLIAEIAATFELDPCAVFGWMALMMESVIVCIDTSIDLATSVRPSPALMHFDLWWSLPVFCFFFGPFDNLGSIFSSFCDFIQFCWLTQAKMNVCSCPHHQIHLYVIFSCPVILPECSKSKADSLSCYWSHSQIPRHLVFQISNHWARQDQ